MPVAASAAARSAIYRSVRRRRRVKLGLLQDVADSPHSVDQARFVSALELQPQVRDVCIDYIRLHPGVVAPHRVQYVLACQYAPGGLEEHLQEAELLRRRRQRLTAPVHGPGRRIERHIAES